MDPASSLCPVQFMQSDPVIISIILILGFLFLVIIYNFQKRKYGRLDRYLELVRGSSVSFLVTVELVFLVSILLYDYFHLLIVLVLRDHGLD